METQGSAIRAAFARLLVTETRAVGWLVVVLLLSSQVAQAQFSQQGPKLVGTGAVPPSFQGSSVALSSDGNTAIVGGASDNSNTGAAWVFTRSGGVWTQQGSKLVGTGAVGSAQQGSSVSLSGDGTTAIVGGPSDNGSTGAAWVFTRSGGVWTQQGSKLVGTGPVGAASQGVSVALSSDGTTAIVGGSGDNGSIGAAWVFTRSGGVWTQQGGKVVGSPATKLQGTSVSLSADGNTAVVGAPDIPLEHPNIGAAFVFTRSGGVWTQQARLVGTATSPKRDQGASVSLSADGNTAIVGAPTATLIPASGGAFVFTRSGGVWTQQAELVGAQAIGESQLQGRSVSLSADGNTAIVGGPGDNGSTGAAWVFTRSGGVWTQQGSKLVGTGAVGAALQGASVSLSSDASTVIVGGLGDNSNAGAAWVYVAPPPPPPLACAHLSPLRDFNGDGRADMLFRRTNGQLALYLMNGAQIQSGTIIGAVGNEWTLVGIGDFNGDGRADFVMRRADGALAIYLLDGSRIYDARIIGTVGPDWRVVGVGDFNGDGKADFLMHRPDGMLAVYLMDGFQFVAAQVIGQIGPEWSIISVADLNGDGRADFMARRGDGRLAVYLMNGLQIQSGQLVGTVGTEWIPVALADFNGDGRGDLLMRRADGMLAMYLMDAGQIMSAQLMGPIGAEWRFVGSGDFNGDGRADFLMRRSDGALALYLVNGFQILSGQIIGALGTDWESCYG